MLSLLVGCQNVQKMRAEDLICPFQRSRAQTTTLEAGESFFANARQTFVAAGERIVGDTGSRRNVGTWDRKIEPSYMCLSGIGREIHFQTEEHDIPFFR